MKIIRHSCWMVALFVVILLAACRTYPIVTNQADSEQQKEASTGGTSKDNANFSDKTSDKHNDKISETSSTLENMIDVMLFMGESNMSGYGGDAELASKVSEDAGMEFRAISDPSKLYPITEPFGANESDPSGLNDVSGVKKGTLVSAFVNEYHKLTGRRVVAVSASMGSADMDVWTSEGVMDDVLRRFESTIDYLESNGYKAGRIYAIWLQGESDGLKGSAESTYRDALANLMKPMFKAGLEKVFVITPGRTIDLMDAYKNVIDTQIGMCVEDDHYVLATTVLTKVSTECMTDQYQYNQHALNYAGIEAAKAVAYFTQNDVKKIVYDYRDGKWIVPKGVKENSQEKEELVYPSDLDINSMF